MRHMESLHIFWSSYPLSEGICPLSADGFLIPQSYKHPCGPCPLPWCTWNPLVFRVSRSTLSTLRSTCGLGLLSGFDLPLIGADRETVASSLQLSGDEGPCKEDGTWRSVGPIEVGRKSWFGIVCSAAGMPTPQWVCSAEAQRKDGVEQEQKATGGADWNASALWGKMECCAEANKKIYDLPAEQQQVGCGIRVRLPSCLTMNTN